MRKVILFLELLVLVVWVGGMLLFAIVVAPAAFSVAPTRDIAGAFVGAILPQINLISYFSLILLTLSCLFSVLPHPTKGSLSRRLLLVLAIIALGVSLYSGLSVSPRIHALRVQIHSFDVSSTQDTARLEFDRLHQRSVTLFGTNLVVGILMLGLWVKDLK